MQETAPLTHPSIARCRYLLLFALLLLPLGVTDGWSAPAEPEQITLVTDFSLSPDGSTLLFSWAGDLWKVSSEGGAAVQVTRDPANDGDPVFSPDGEEIAFTSNRENSEQIFVMPAAGGPPEQRTFHSEGYDLIEYDRTGDRFLVSARRDHFWRSPQRFFFVDRHKRTADELLFDGYGKSGTLSPDGRQLLFTRESTGWFRKGYRGSQAAQIWLYDLDSKEFTELLHDDHGFRYPQWMPDGKGFYYVGQQSGSFNLWEYRFDAGTREQLTRFDDDSVLWPAISRDGSTIVFRHLFDLYRYQPESGEPPRRIEIRNAGEPVREKWLRRSITSANEADFTDDGLEVAFIAGGDLWVMDTELKEPRQVTDTPEMESEPVFTADGQAVLFISNRDGQCDIWRAERSDEALYWWQNDEFAQKRLTADAEVESDLKFDPEGKRLAFVRGAGDLMTMDEHGKDLKRVLSSWNPPGYDWSPDGKWMVYSLSDNDFNSDIWITSTDGSGEPFNLSVHPDNDQGPVWSPDGKKIAFTGRRADKEVDVYYVWLTLEEAEKDSRDRKLEKALKKMEKERKKKKDGKDGKDKKEAEEEKTGKKKEPGKRLRKKKDDGKDEPEEPSDEDKEEGEKKDDEKKKDEKKKKDKPPEVVIDFEGIHDRIKRISVADSSESGLFWIDENKLAFSSSPKGDRGVYTVTFPDELSPKKLTDSSLSSRRKLKKAKSFGGISGGQPATMTTAGKVTKYSFRVNQEQLNSERQRAAFLEAWRIMRDRFYDERLGNRNWGAIRRKYVDMAAEAIDMSGLAHVVSLMLGELNGSHLGFSAGGMRFGRGPRSSASSRQVTAHLGLRFDESYKGPGWKVKDVIKMAPAAEKESRIERGEIVLSVDGASVDPSLDVSQVLNGEPARDVELRVRSADGEERTVTLRPISYGTARRRLYDMWLDYNRIVVDRVSKNSLGYMHIRGMNWSSFLKFEEELYRIGYGKDGLIIDVRGNGGGFTTDHLLTALTQPAHAITRPRGGGEGYPQDRSVYATWNKPVIVLCDQDSFSNAEIFSHAIKNLGRGQLVGVPTAGGVISTGGAMVMDVGFIRTPFRGWYLVTDGEDMELNGAVPNHIIWPEPGQVPKGKDSQLLKAVEVLLEDVASQQPPPTLRKAAER